MMGKISVCIATYNGAKYIKEQLESILCQLSEDDEVIVSDDSSTDETLQRIAELDDSRIQIYIFDRDKSGLSLINLVTTNFENALKKATGEIIFLADQDDVWCENKDKIMSLILKEYDYVVSDCYLTDSNLIVKSNTRFDGSVTLSRWKALYKPTPWQGCCAAFRRSVLEKSLPFPKGIQSHDRWIGYVASFFFTYKILEDPLIFYRRHDTNASTSTGKSRNGIVYKIRTRLKYIYELIKLKFR